MAAAKSNFRQDSSFNFESSCHSFNKTATPSVKIVDLCFILLSLGTFIADYTTDVILVISYFENGHTLWAVMTVVLIVLPSVLIHVISIRWHIQDGIINPWHWLFHIFLLGIVHRYVSVLKTGIEARSSSDYVDYQRLIHQQSDICMLHLFESFLESAPQLVLQLYIMISLEDWQSWTGISAIASLVSLSWAIAAYTRAMRRSRPEKQSISWSGLILQASWRLGLLGARITSLVLFAICFQIWIFLVLGIHWLFMTIWILFQKTDFCPTSWEEKVYNCVVGVIYCFCFFNLQDGQSRKRATAFYTIIVIQNMICLALFISLQGSLRPIIALVGIIVIIGGTVLGISSMLLYYGYFHPTGQISLCTSIVKENIENGSGNLNDKTGTIRSLKYHCNSGERENSLKRKSSSLFQQASPQSDDGYADKKSLLQNWSSFQSSNPNDNSTEEKDKVPEIENVTRTLSEPNDSGSSLTMSENDIRKQKRRGICSLEELRLDVDDEDDDMLQIMNDSYSYNTQKKKRLAICSYDNDIEVELGETMSEENERSRLKQNEDMKKQKRRGICPPVNLDLFDKSSIIKIDPSDAYIDTSLLHRQNSDVSLTEVDIQSKLAEMEKAAADSSSLKPSELQLAGSDDSPSEVFSAPSEVLSVPSEVLSAHDYENICAVNIAREAWGLRSWRGYSDIETWLHDDSVVRDRRRDTLTSTVTTITSASSENSNASGEPVSTNASPPPIPCRRPHFGPRLQRTRQDDYLDTLVDDLADCESIQQTLAEFIAEPDLESHIFVARPCVVDQHGAFYPLTTLDTIMEELEESSSDTGEIVKHRQRYDSASTLVATIEEIRLDDSLCNLYNSSDPLWDSHNSDSNSEEQSILPSNNSLHSNTFPRSLLTSHSRSHLSAEEVLFLSKLQSPISCETSPITFDKVNQPTSPISEVILDAKSYLTPNKMKNNLTSVELVQHVNSKNNQPRRKFSLLREKFELSEINSTNEVPKEKLSNLTSEALQMPYTVCKPKSFGDTKNIMQCNQGQIANTSNVFQSKDYVLPAVKNRIKQWNYLLKSQNSCSGKLNYSVNKITVKPNNVDEGVENYRKTTFLSMKERRSMFLKQVLSPSKSWTKKGSTCNASKEIYAV